MTAQAERVEELGENDIESELSKQIMSDCEQSYKVHSNNSPDDLSILTSGKKLPKQLKWILVSEGNDPTTKES